MIILDTFINDKYIKHDNKIEVNNGIRLKFQDNDTYSTEEQTAEILNYILLSNIEVLNFISDIPADTDIKGYITLNSIDFYFNGAEWVERDTQTNTLDEISDNISTAITESTHFKMSVILSTTDDQKTPELTKALLNVKNGYSSIEALRSNIENVAENEYPDHRVYTAIIETDEEINLIIGSNLDTTKKPYQTFINRLSQYGTAVKVLERCYSSQQNIEQNNDITFWKNKYNNMLDIIKVSGFNGISSKGFGKSENRDGNFFKVNYALG